MIFFNMTEVKIHDKEDFKRTRIKDDKNEFKTINGWRY